MAASMRRRPSSVATRGQIILSRAVSFFPQRIGLKRFPHFAVTHEKNSDTACCTVSDCRDLVAAFCVGTVRDYSRGGDRSFSAYHRAHGSREAVVDCSGAGGHTRREGTWTHGAHGTCQRDAFYF